MKLTTKLTHTDPDKLEIIDLEAYDVTFNRASLKWNVSGLFGENVHHGKLTVTSVVRDGPELVTNLESPYS